MNIFSNIGITELVVILLVALLVVGPERLPEMGRTLAKTLRDLRNAYENLTKDLGPELMSIQETTQELRESVESITAIPQDVISSVVSAADLDDTVSGLKNDLDSFQQIGQTLSGTGKMIKDPVGAAVDTARGALLPSQPDESGVAAEGTGGEDGKVADTVSDEDPSLEPYEDGVPDSLLETLPSLGASEQTVTEEPDGAKSTGEFEVDEDELAGRADE